MDEALNTVQRIKFKIPEFEEIPESERDPTLMRVLHEIEELERQGKSFMELQPHQPNSRKEKQMSDTGKGNHEADMLLSDASFFIALDGMGLEQAKSFVAMVDEGLDVRSKMRVGFKVGLKFIHAKTDKELINFISERQHFEIFYDCKLKDIPNTMKEAAEEIQKLNVDYFNVHASSGIDAMMDVKEVTTKQVLAVSVLTSFQEDEAHLIYGAPTKAKVLLFARYAKLAKCEGVICSPQELQVLKTRRELDDCFLFVVPGIRPKWATKKDDQARVMTPGDAVKAFKGAARDDFQAKLVIGRPITKASEYGLEPVDAIKKILAEIDETQEKEGVDAFSRLFYGSMKDDSEEE